MISRLFGIILMILIIIFSGLIKLSKYAENYTYLDAYVDIDKRKIFEDPEIKKFLKEKYKIEIKFDDTNPIEFSVRRPLKKLDFLWPSNINELEFIKNEYKNEIIKSELILRTPLVFYSWDKVTEVLIKEKIVSEKEGIYYIKDFNKLIQLIKENKKWADIGLNNIFGKISISFPKVNLSYLGIAFISFLGNIMYNDILDDEGFNKISKDLKSFIMKNGNNDITNSTELFEQYIQTGMEGKPLIVGFENQIIEFSEKNHDKYENMKSKIRILYPEPTIWNSFPIITLNKKSDRLLTALKDPDLQKIIWTKYGYRWGEIGGYNDVKLLIVKNIPEEIKLTTNLPSKEIIERLINYISENNANKTENKSSKEDTLK